MEIWKGNLDTLSNSMLKRFLSGIPTKTPYESLKVVGYEDSMTSESQKIAQNLLGIRGWLKVRRI